MTKRELRARVRAACPDAETLAAESRAVCGHILRWDVFREARCVAAFVPMRGEADIRPLLEESLRREKTLLLPRTEKDFSMRFLRVRRLSDCVPDAWGIPAPPEDAEEPAPDGIDLMLLPLCAADAAGNRLGQGGGCYDRWLAAHPVRAPRVGAALAYQRADAVPTDPWDRPLDGCAFPTGMLLYPRI